MNNFAEVTKERYMKEIDHIKAFLNGDVEKFKLFWYSNGLFDAVISEDRREVFVRDIVEHKYYACSTVFIDLISSLIGMLSAHDLRIREGFVDKSLNTELYSKIDKFFFGIGPMFFRFEELEQLRNKILNLIDNAKQI